MRSKTYRSQIDLTKWHTNCMLEATELITFSLTLPFSSEKLVICNYHCFPIVCDSSRDGDQHILDLFLGYQYHQKP